MIIKRLPLLIAGGIGYVLGAKAGRERYDQLRSQFDKVKNDPRVQEKAQQATDLAKEKAPVVKDKLTEAAGAAHRQGEVGHGRRRRRRPLNPDRLKVTDRQRPAGHPALIVQ